jgi:hypothetical protein
MSNFVITESGLRWLEVILLERFGYFLNLRKNDQYLYMSLSGAQGQIIFDRPEKGFFDRFSDLSFMYWDAASEGWHSPLGLKLPAPGLNDHTGVLIEKNGPDHFVHYDIMGLTYWMLARVEEVGAEKLDQHSRFEAISSHAYKNGYLDRPIVDEWLHVLGQLIQCQWPSIKLKTNEFKVLLSHDVDRPARYAFVSGISLIRRMIGDVSRGRLSDSVLGPWIRLNSKNKLHALDPYNTFKWLIDKSKQYGHQSAFYFISGHTNLKMDGDYDIAHPAIRKLLRYINEQEQEIGFHLSYNTYNKSFDLKKEVDCLKSVCAEEGIYQNLWGSRMHYLRWQHPETLIACDEAGINYDSTLGYADQAGFRCGTSFEYPAFDPKACVMLNIRIRPLIVMDVTVFGENYMAKNVSNDALSVFVDLKRKVQLVNGNFTMLWHNSELVEAQSKKCYEDILKS